MLGDRYTVADVLAARNRIVAYLPPTPAHNYPTLDKLFGCQVWLKHENHQPTGAFKVRGGVNLCACLAPEEGRRGLITASTGNHGQSIAYAARLFRLPATIFVPDGANPDKVAAIENLGAKVRYHGENFEICRHYAESFANESGARFVSAGNEPLLIPGVATYALEFFAAQPELDAVYVPIGGGSGACGCCIVGHAVRPGVKIIGVQSAQAPAVYNSWKSGKPQTTATADTFADGLATLSTFEMTFAILQRELDDFQLVTDAELKQAIRLLLTHTHNIAEGAGAAAFAAAYREREKFAGKKIGLVLSGGNLTTDMLRAILAEA